MPSTASRQNSLTSRHPHQALVEQVDQRGTEQRPDERCPSRRAMLTPPTTAAAIAASSRPGPAVTVIVPKRARNMKPASPGERAARGEGPTVIRRSGRPGLPGGLGVGADGVEQRPTREPPQHELQHHDDTTAIRTRRMSSRRC